MLSKYDEDLLVERVLCIESVLTAPATTIQLREVGLALLLSVQLQADSTSAVAVDWSFNVSGVMVFNGYAAGQLNDNSSVGQDVLDVCEATLLQELHPCGFRAFSLEDYADGDNGGIAAPNSRALAENGSAGAARKRYVVSMFTTSAAPSPSPDMLTTAPPQQATTTTTAPPTAVATTSRDVNFATASPGSSSPLDDNAIIILGVLGFVVLVVVIAILVWCCCCAKKKKRDDERERRKVHSRSIDAGSWRQNSKGRTSTEQGAEDENEGIELSTTFASARARESKDSSVLPPRSTHQYAPSDVLASFVPPEWLRDFHPSEKRSTIFLKPQ